MRTNFRRIAFHKMIMSLICDLLHLKTPTTTLEQRCLIKHFSVQELYQKSLLHLRDGEKILFYTLITVFNKQIHLTLFKINHKISSSFTAFAIKFTIN